MPRLIGRHAAFVRGLAGLAAMLVVAVPARAACPPEGQSLASLQALKAARWQGPTPQADAARPALALALLDCLASPDPVLRDGIAFEALQAWMRGRVLDEATVRQVQQRVGALLSAPPDAAGLVQPFAALVLAEVARVDRLQPFLQPDERDALVKLSASYLQGVRDYRAFDPREGWRHGVAHGADGLLQWALNPALTRVQADALLAAIASQVLPAGAHAWQHGEPDRLMAPVFYLARRPFLSAAEWQAWLVGLAARRAPAVPTTALALAQRHNLGMFLNSLYVSVAESPDAALRERLMPGLRQVLKQLD